MSQSNSMRAVVAALAANLGIAASKFIAFAFTGSSAMLSEAIHSVADSGNQVLLLIGNHRASQPADAQHNFGYGRRRFVYGFIVSIVLFVVGGVFSIYEGIHKFVHPDAVSDAWIAFVVLGVSIALEGLSLRTALGEVRSARGVRNLWQFLRDARQPELPVVVLEDLGALVGLAFALIGVSLAVITGNGRWDGMGAMAVGTLLVVIAVFLSLEMTAMLVGESALPEDVEAIRGALESSDGVLRVIHLRTVHVGPEELLVAAKIAVNPHATASVLADQINAAEAAVRAQVPHARYLFIEPDIERDPAH